MQAVIQIMNSPAALLFLHATSSCLIRRMAIQPYYHVGSRSYRSCVRKIAWGDTWDYDSWSISECCLNLDSRVYAIEIHQVDLLNNCFYEVGKIKTSGKSIQWEHSDCGKLELS